MRDDIPTSETELIAPTSETELIARARSGDGEAFCALAARYGRRVHSLARHFCRDAADAEDLSQEVWLRAFRSLHTFRAESSFYTWLRRIAVNTFLNDRRAAHARPGPAADAHGVAETGASASDAEAVLNDRLLAGRVRLALAELSPQQRLVFLLKHEEGMTYEEIARALSCSTGTAKKSLFRAVAKLRERLSAADGADGGAPDQPARAATRGEAGGDGNAALLLHQPARGSY